MNEFQKSHDSSTSTESATTLPATYISHDQPHSPFNSSHPLRPKFYCLLNYGEDTWLQPSHKSNPSSLGLIVGRNFINGLRSMDWAYRKRNRPSFVGLKKFGNEKRQH